MNQEVPNTGRLQKNTGEIHIRRCDYYIWAVQGAGRTIVFDSGVRPALADERKLGGYVSPDKALTRIGIDAKKAEHLVISHIHFDHGGGIELFPNAKIYVQRKEYDFWVYDPISRRPPYAAVADPVANKQFGDLRGSRIALYSLMETRRFFLESSCS